MQHSIAFSIAQDIARKLQPHCSVVNIAGSLRRRKLEVKDIEIVCLPVMKVQKDLFNSITASGRSAEFISLLKSFGTRHAGNLHDGRQVKILLPQQIVLDVYIPQPEDYYRIYAIRTGSTDYSINVIAKAWAILKAIECCIIV